MSAGRSYQVTRVLGRGGFGVVYLARFQGEGDFSKDVALKILNPNIISPNADIVRRLRDEARILGLLNHRAIVAVDRLIELRGRWTVVMEYAEGADLARILRGSRVPAGAALEIAGEVAGALHAAYTRKNVSGEIMRLHHRDIKPSNIQITPYGGVKVLDFGIARADFAGREAHSTRVGGRFGTPAYMPPERLYLKADGPEGDIYALGTVLFEMLTGREFGHACRSLDRHDELIVDSVKDLRAVEGVDHEIVDLLRSMLAWNPIQRPSAEGVERRCIALRGRPGGEPLRYWSERVVGALLDESAHNTAIPPELMEEGEENLTGMEISEGPAPYGELGSKKASPPSTFPGDGPLTISSRRRMAYGGAVLGVAAALTGVGWSFHGSGPASAADPPAALPRGGLPTANPSTASTPTPMPVDTPASTTAGMDVAADRASAASVRSVPRHVVSAPAVAQPTVTPVVASPEPAPPPALILAKVTVTGDAGGISLTNPFTHLEVHLRSGEPAELPPGAYTLAATFADGSPLPSMPIQLSDGRAELIDCQTSFHKCMEK